MVESQKLNRPQVRGTVVLTVFLAVLQLLSGALNLSALNSAGTVVPASYSIAVYVSIGFGILLLVDAFLIATYKRIGLIIGLVAYVILLLLSLVSLVSTQSFDLLGILTLVLMVAAIYYLYRYLTREPEKQFFT